MSSVIAHHANKEKVARHAREAAEAKMEVERMKLKVEKEKRVNEQAKGKRTKKKIMSELSVLRSEITEKENELANITARLSDAKLSLKSTTDQLNHAVSEYNTMTTKVENVKLQSTNAYNYGTVDNRVTNNSHNYYNHQSGLAVTSLPFNAGGHICNPQVLIQAPSGYVLQDRRHVHFFLGHER